MAELVDAHDSKSCGSNVMGVRFPLSAHGTGNNQTVGDGGLSLSNLA